MLKLKTGLLNFGTENDLKLLNSKYFFPTAWWNLFSIRLPSPSAGQTWTRWPGPPSTGWMGIADLPSSALLAWPLSATCRSELKSCQILNSCHKRLLRPSTTSNLNRLRNYWLSSGVVNFFTDNVGILNRKFEIRASVFAAFFICNFST